EEGGRKRLRVERLPPQIAVDRFTIMKHRKSERSKEIRGFLIFVRGKAPQLFIHFIHHAPDPMNEIGQCPSVNSATDVISASYATYRFCLIRFELFHSLNERAIGTGRCGPIWSIRVLSEVYWRPAQLHLTRSR